MLMNNFQSTLLAVGARNPSNNINNSDDDHLILWRVDPTGQFWRLHASAVGRGGMKIEAELLQHVQRWKKLEQQHSYIEYCTFLLEEMRKQCSNIKMYM